MGVKVCHMAYVGVIRKLLQHGRWRTSLRLSTMFVLAKLLTIFLAQPKSLLLELIIKCISTTSALYTMVNQRDNISFLSEKLLRLQPDKVQCTFTGKNSSRIRNRKQPISGKSSTVNVNGHICESCVRIANEYNKVLLCITFKWLF